MKSGNFSGFLPFLLLFGTFRWFLLTEIKRQDVAQYVESPQGDFEGNSTVNGSLHWLFDKKTKNGNALK